MLPASPDRGMQERASGYDPRGMPAGTVAVGDAEIVGGTALRQAVAALVKSAPPYSVSSVLSFLSAVASSSW